MSGDGVSGAQHHITQLLKRHRSGDPHAIDELIPLVYYKLRDLARRHMARESPGHTLQQTALVHEAYLELVRADVDWTGRAHFFAVAARVMRHILVDHARTKRRQKRGGGAEPVPLDEIAAAIEPPSIDVLQLDDALRQLATLNERQSAIVEMRYFGGMTHEEMGMALDLSATSVDRDLRLAKAWLRRRLTGTL